MVSPGQIRTTHIEAGMLTIKTASIAPSFTLKAFWQPIEIYIPRGCTILARGPLYKRGPLVQHRL
jgi:hypothetical protein